MSASPSAPATRIQLAKSIIDIATGEKPDRDPVPKKQTKDQSAKASKEDSRDK